MEMPHGTRMRMSNQLLSTCRRLRSRHEFDGGWWRTDDGDGSDTGETGAAQGACEREGSVVARAQQERNRELWKDGSKDEFRIQFRGGVGPQVMQSNSQILKSIRPIHPALCHTRTRRPQLVGDGVITTFMPRSSLCPWPKLCSLSVCVSLPPALLPSPSPGHPLPPPARSHGFRLIKGRSRVGLSPISVDRASDGLAPILLVPEWQTPDDRAVCQ